MIQKTLNVTETSRSQALPSIGLTQKQMDAAISSEDLQAGRQSRKNTLKVNARLGRPVRDGTICVVFSKPSEGLHMSSQDQSNTASITEQSVDAGKDLDVRDNRFIDENNNGIDDRDEDDSEVYLKPSNQLD